MTSTLDLVKHVSDSLNGGDGMSSFMTDSINGGDGMSSFMTDSKDGKPNTSYLMDIMTSRRGGR